MQVKDLKNLSPNLEVFAAHQPVRQTDADVFGSLFNVACYDAAETHSLSPREVRQRAYDHERLDSFDSRRRRPIEPAGPRVDNNSIDNVTRSEQCSEHDALDSSRSRLRQEGAGDIDLSMEAVGLKGTAENNGVVEVPVNNENNLSGQVLNNQMMMNDPAEQGAVALVRDSKGNIVNTDSAQSNNSETTGEQKTSLQTQQIQNNKNATQGLEKQPEANVSKQAVSTESGKVVSDELKLLLTENDESQQYQGDIENSGNAKGAAVSVDESGSRAAKAQNTAHNLTAYENDKNVVEPLSLDALARSLQVEKNEAVHSNTTVEQSQNSSQLLATMPADNTNMSNGSFAGRGNKNNNNPLETLTHGGMKVDSEKPADLQNVITPQKTTDVGTPDMQHNVDRRY